MQIAESVNGKRRIVRHLGSAHDEAQLGLLVQHARQLLADDHQGVLDLGLAPKMVKASLIPAPAETLLPQAQDGKRQLVAGGRVVKSSSAVLYDALAGVYASLGFDRVDDAVFADLVIARVVEPTSLLDADRVLAELGQRSASHSTRKRCLRRAHAGDYRAQIARACFEHVADSGDVSLVLYDVTTLYFEAEHEDQLRRVGYSKERRVDPQIVVGLLVDRNGFPLEIGCYEGNKAETRTIIPIVKQFQGRHGIADMVVVADAGMLSAANLNELDAAGLRFIVGSRMTKAPYELAAYFATHGDYADDGHIVDTLTPRRGARLAEEHTLSPIWDPGTHPKAWRAVWQYRRKRALRDQRTLNQQRARAIAIIEGDTRPKNARFVTTTNAKKTFDESSYNAACRLTGWKGYVTNIDAGTMPAGEVITSYHDLWHVEQSFRMSKTDLRARPIFARTKDAIEAHLTIVFAALAIARTVQNRTGLSLRRVLRTLKPLRSATININGTTTTLPPEIQPEQQIILDHLNPPS